MKVDQSGGTTGYGTGPFSEGFVDRQVQRHTIKLININTNVKGQVVIWRRQLQVVRDWIEKFRDHTWLDVGANFGNQFFLLYLVLPILAPQCA